MRNEAAFRLARIHFQKGQPEDALQTLEKIRGKAPEEIRDDVEFLRANVYMALGRPSDAVGVLQRLQGSEGLKGFSEYNLGIALLEDGRPKEAVEQLDRAGQVQSRDPATLAIVDKSNLVLGTMLFEASAFEESERSLDRVRLEGPFSNQALLRAGWADATAEKFDRALVPWSILSEREPTDAAVQEAELALPYAYSKLGVHGRAAVLYRQAADNFEGELRKLDASLKSIDDGDFLKDLVREEIRQDKDWVIRLRSLPDAPETFYLATLMASHEFQTGLQNYLDLEDMRKKLVSWQGSLAAFEDLIRRRRAVLRAAAARDRCAVPQARLTDPRARRATRPPRRAPAAHADRPETGLPGDRGRAAGGGADPAAGDRVAKRERRRSDRPVAPDRSPEGRADLEPRDELPRAADRRPTSICAS